LPDSVLQSLTSAAAKNDPSLLLNSHSQKPEGTITTAAAKKIAAKSSPANVKNPPPLIASVQDENTKGQIDSDKTIVGMAPTVMELRKTAEESIAAVTARKPKDQSTSTTTTTTSTSTKRIDEKRKELSPESASATEGAATATSTNSNESKPTYSKRRKKPRLSDCETKLAQLKAENEQLKRHLQNVSNKAHKFDKEKEEAGKNIARLIHDPNAGPREMGMSVRKFSDMYSDYGVNRQQELSFHLEQLQR
jgi:chromosome segregation ATPase